MSKKNDMEELTAYDYYEGTENPPTLTAIKADHELISRLRTRLGELEKYAVHRQWTVHGGMDYGEMCDKLKPKLNPSDKRLPCNCGLDELLEIKT